MASKAQFLREYKLVVVGDGAVGKSNLTLQFIQSRFDPGYDPTVEDCYTRQCIIDDEVATLEILDTAGQEEYRELRSTYYRSAEGFLLVYSITARSSFEAMPDAYESILREKDQESFPVVLVGNKCDLEYERQVQMSQGRELAAQFGCLFIETSAKLRINVDEAFHALVRRIRKFNTRPRYDEFQPTRRDVGPGEEHTGGCCGGCVVL